ncbi:hypothetical protein FKM82_001198 [Ascaphus truei]
MHCRWRYLCCSSSRELPSDPPRGGLCWSDEGYLLNTGFPWTPPSPQTKSSSPQTPTDAPSPRRYSPPLHGVCNKSLGRGTGRGGD